MSLGGKGTRGEKKKKQEPSLNRKKRACKYISMAQAEHKGTSAGQFHQEAPGFRGWEKGGRHAR